MWSPQYGAYYFFNSKTQETTWSNPLQPNAEAGPSTAAPPPQANTETPTAPAAAKPAAPTPAEVEGIDPSLAHLLGPSAAAGVPAAYSYTAKFNARTGAFAKVDARDPTHLSEFERAKRMSEVYFDVGGWQAEVDARHAKEMQDEAEGISKKRKKPTKADLVRLSAPFV